MIQFSLFWERYKKGIPEDSPPIQFKECKSAFYYGALGMLEIMLEAAEDDIEDDEGADYLEQIKNEIVDTLKKDKAH